MSATWHCERCDASHLGDCPHADQALALAWVIRETLRDTTGCSDIRVFDGQVLSEVLADRIIKQLHR